MKLAIHWFRRDLRFNDNHALYEALKSGNPVLGVFIFDTEILLKLEDKDDARVTFIYNELKALNDNLVAQGSSLLILKGKPIEVWKDITTKFDISAVYTNTDYEPYALERDAQISHYLKTLNIPIHFHKDHVIFEKEEISKDDGTAYTVFTPFSKKWKQRLAEYPINIFPSEQYISNFYKTDNFIFPSLQEIGFEANPIVFPEKTTTTGIIKNYNLNRDFPAVNGTSRLSLHFRFGTVSIREKVLKALSLNETWLNELIWRDFYITIIYRFPHVVNNPFKPAYSNIEWQNNPKEFEAWCNGKTGYPLVDAGMRELNATGFMHNRVRMVVASFLSKHLLIDWRWGEAWFARKLLDFELASNNGGWQWAAGCGTDAAPYFRIFNPTAQAAKFDPENAYIKKWIPEFGTAAYPTPIVNHEFARNRCLEAYKRALS